MTHEKRINALYLRELGGSLLLYAVVLYCALTYGAPMPAGTAKTFVMVSPMIPALLTVWAIARHVVRIDEFARLWQLQNIAIAFAVSAAVSFTYGFLENAGFPRLSMFVVWPFMGAVWGLLCIFRAVLGR